MKKVLNRNIEAGSQESNEPRLLGSIVSEMLHGQSPLARGYRQYIASQEKQENEEEAETETDRLFKNYHPNTHLGVNLKTFLRNDRLMKRGKGYVGILRRDTPSEDFGLDDEHFTFVEALPMTAKRNPHVFDGRFITITRRDDGSLRLNFKELRMGAGFTVDGYAIGLYVELREALKGLVEEEMSE